MSSAMPHVTGVTPAVLDTILDHMAPLFLAGTGGDPFAARHAAGCMLASYDAETEEEVRLAAEVVSFSFQTLEALGQAVAPDLPLNKVLRLRSGAVNLNRAAHRSQRKLDQVLRERRAVAHAAAEAPLDATAPFPWPDPSSPAVVDRPGGPMGDPTGDVRADPVGEPDVAPIGLSGRKPEAPEPGGRSGGRPWSPAHQQRLAAARITETLRRNQAEHARREASHATPAVVAAAGAAWGGADMVEPESHGLRRSAAV